MKEKKTDLDIPNLNLKFSEMTKKQKKSWNKARDAMAKNMEKRMRENPGFIPSKQNIEDTMEEIEKLFEMIKDENLEGRELEALEGVMCMLYSASLTGKVEELLCHCHPWNKNQLERLQKESGISMFPA